MRRCSLYLGVDPSLTNTGLTVLSFELGSETGTAVLRHHFSDDKAKEPLHSRLFRLNRRVGSWVEECYMSVGDLTAVVCEDPTDYRAVRMRSGSSTAKLGAAAGAVMCALVEVCGRLEVPLFVYPTQEWLPRQNVGRGGWTSPVRHDRVVEFYRQSIKGLSGASDDETMAAGLIMYHRTAELRGKRE